MPNYIKIYFVLQREHSLIELERACDEWCVRKLLLYVKLITWNAHILYKNAVCFNLGVTCSKY